MTVQNEETRAPGTAYWWCFFLTAVSAFVGLGYAIAAVVGDSQNEYTLYAATRSIALAFAVVVLAFVHSRIALVLLALTMTLTQALDGVVGAIIGDPLRTFGPFVLALLTAVVAVILARRSRR